MEIVSDKAGPFNRTEPSWTSIDNGNIQIRHSRSISLDGIPAGFWKSMAGNPEKYEIKFSSDKFFST